MFLLKVQKRVVKPCNLQNQMLANQLDKVKTSTLWNSMQIDFLAYDNVNSCRKVSKKWFKIHLSNSAVHILVKLKLSVDSRWRRSPYKGYSLGFFKELRIFLSSAKLMVCWNCVKGLVDVAQKQLYHSHYVYYSMPGNQLYQKRESEASNFPSSFATKL